MVLLEAVKRETGEQSLSKYVGKYVAFVDEKIVASGRTQLEAYTRAKKNHPHKIITLEYVPTRKETVTFL